MSDESDPGAPPTTEEHAALERVMSRLARLDHTIKNCRAVIDDDSWEPWEPWAQALFECLQRAEMERNELVRLIVTGREPVMGSPKPEVRS